MTQAKLTEMAIRAGKGDRDALDVIVPDVDRYVQTMAWKYRTLEFQDLCQDMWVGVLKNIHQFNNGSAFSTWLYRLCNNVAVNVIREECRESRRLDSTNAITYQEVDFTNEMIQQIPKAAWREVIGMIIVDGYSFPECADKLGLKYDCMYVRYRRGIAWLREHWSELTGERK